MKIDHPSAEFDQAVAAVCHGDASEEQLRALNQLLRQQPAARDEYILRLELHSRLASDPDLFARDDGGALPSFGVVPPLKVVHRPGVWRWALALAACVAVLAGAWWIRDGAWPGVRKGDTSKAVAMLSRVVEAEWNGPGDNPRPGAPLEPGWVRLKSGLAQIVFYSGARVVIEGPAELQLVSPGEAFCPQGRLVAEVPPQARGFRIRTARMNVTDLGTVFGVDVKPGQTELHVFRGLVEMEALAGGPKHGLREGQGAVAEGAGAPRIIPASRAGFASLFDLQNKSTEAEALRHEQWRAHSGRLDEDPSLLVHFQFEPDAPSDWRLPNAARNKEIMPDATIVGCQWGEGRWPDKRALDFRGVSDRVRLTLPGEFEALTLAVWLRVQGLDREINSLFMSDGFAAGTVHWCLRHDGVLGLTVIGPEPGHYQICASPPALTLDQFGLWVHLAVVVDGGGSRVVHYLNGTPVSEHALRIRPPYRIGVAELGNWNAQGFPRNDPFTIRNFSGAMDEFCLFSRALPAEDIRALYSAGKPQPDPIGSSRK